MQIQTSIHHPPINNCYFTRFSTKSQDKLLLHHQRSPLSCSFVFIGLPDKTASYRTYRRYPFGYGRIPSEMDDKKRNRKIISSLRQLTVQHVASSHCTGQKAKKLFAQYFGQNYIDIGAGNTIIKADLK
jgi:hypothetical protein